LVCTYKLPEKNPRVRRAARASLEALAISAAQGKSNSLPIKSNRLDRPTSQRRRQPRALLRSVDSQSARRSDCPIPSTSRRNSSRGCIPANTSARTTCANCALRSGNT